MIETVPSLSPQPSTVIAPEVRATPTLSQAQRLALRQAQRQRMAVRVEVLRRAKAEIKRQLAAHGIKPQTLPMREIVAMAEARLLADAAYRAELIAEARKVVAVWEAKGYFKPRRAAVQHLQLMHSARRPEPQAL
jgi:hypothetical protein